MEPFGTSLPVNLQANRSLESDALSSEILLHQEEDKNRSYLSRLVVGLTEAFHGNDKSLEHMDALRQSAMLANMAGDSKKSQEIQKQMTDAVSQDKEARKSADSWSSHTGNFVKSVGLFFPGRAGYAVAALTNAADSAHPADSLLRQSVDGVLGASKGAVMKFGFDKVGQSEMNMALKAGTLSISNRFAEIGLNSHTYFDQKTADFDLQAGLWKTAKAVADPRQLGMDMLTFGGGYLLLNKLGVTPEFARANPMLAQTITGAGFGFSSGFFSDMQMQQKLGDGFNMGSALKSAFLQMGLDGTAAAIGGYRIQQMQSAGLEGKAQTAKELPAATQSLRLDMSKVEGIFGLDNRPVARPRSLSNADTGRTSLSQGTADSVTVASGQVESPASKVSLSSALLSEASMFNLAKNASANPESTSVHLAGQLAQSGKISGSEAEAVRVSAEAKVAEPIAPEAKGGMAILRELTRGDNSGIREFVTRENVSGLLPALRAQGLNAQALLKVREVLSGSESAPELGPEKTILIQHLEPGLKLAPEKAASADLLATCDPKLLESLGVKDVGQRHLFPEAGSSPIMLQVPGSNRLRFSLPEALESSGFASEPTLALGKEKATAPGLYRVENPRDPYERGPFTPSSLLRGLGINDNLANVHSIDGRLSIDEIAQAMQNVKLPAERIIGGGGDSIAFELSDGNILKVTDRPWLPEWGTRTLDWRGQPVRFDANILGTPRQIKFGDQTITYYVQQKGITPVSKADARLFDSLLSRDGKYVFWDQDASDLAHGPDQLAYVPLQKFKSGLLTAIPIADPATGRLSRGLALIDFDAVRVEGTEPQFDSSQQRSWRYGRYDFSPVERK